MRGKLLALAALAGVAGLVPAGEARAQEAGKVAAIVNGQKITMADIEAVIAMRPPAPVELPAAKRRELQRDILFMLMDNALMEQFLQKNAPRIDEAEINKRMAQLEQEVKKLNKTMQDYYKENHQTEKQVRAALAQILQWEAYVNGLIKEADVKRYYDENKDFFDGVTVRASHILVKVPANASDAQRQAARQKLLAVRQQIVSGQIDFAAAARKHSECPSAPEGGDIGSFPRKMVVDEAFARTAFALKVGEVSDVVATDFGLHLIKVTERKPGTQPSKYDEIKSIVRDFCIEELRQTILARERQAAKIEVFLEK